MVDVVNDGGQIVAGRSGDNDLAGTCIDMGLCLGLAGIETGALEDDINAKLAPGQISCVRHLVDDDLLAVNNDVVVFAFALMVLNGVALRNIVALRGVVLQQVREHLRRSQVVDGDDFVALSAKHLTERQTADTAKTIDCNFNRHNEFPPYYLPAGCRPIYCVFHNILLNYTALFFCCPVLFYPKTNGFCLKIFTISSVCPNNLFGWLKKF